MAKAEEKDTSLLEEQAEFRRAAKRMVQDEFASPTPLWYRVIMFSLIILGVLWIMAYYITNGLFPILSAGTWNIGIGVILMMVGMLMTTRWR